MSDFQELMLEHLKCVICTEYNASMLQCYNGHSHCRQCMKKYEIRAMHKRDIKCAVCASKRGWGTNRQMLQLAIDSNLQIMCNVDGCTEMLCANKLDNHRKTCKEKLFICPVHGMECRFVKYDKLFEHVSEHNKLIHLSESSTLLLAISELVNYGPRTILFQRHVIQLNCYITYDRRNETRLVMKCIVIGPEMNSGVKIQARSWNLLKPNNHSNHEAELDMLEEFNGNELDETITFSGMKQYVSESPDTVIMLEKVIHDEFVPNEKIIGCKIHPFDVNEESQEIYIITVRFDTICSQ